MIAKTDLVIITLASAMLIFAIARSNTDVRLPVTAPISHSGINMPAAAPTGTVTVASNLQTGNTSGVTLTAGEVISTSATSFQEPDVIKDASFRTYVVKSGDVLSRIALKYNTSVSELQSLNNLQGTVIHVGQELVYPTQ